MKSQTKRFVGKLWKPGVGVFYALIMLEGLWMVSAFGIYLYSIFGPAQSLLEGSAATNWLTDFYLSHFVTWSPPSGVAASGSRPLSELPFNPFRLNIFANRNLFWFLGFGLFFVGALQVYHSKVTKRGAVITGLYRYIRHPQYVGFIIVGIPFLVMWPRFILLVSFVTMTYFYVFLALHEESLCMNRYGSAYEEYLERTSMFVPGDKYIFRPLRQKFGSYLRFNAKQVAFFSGLYIFLIASAVSTAYWFKHRTTALVPYEQKQDLVILALQNADRWNVREIAGITETDPRVQRILQQARSQASNYFLVYILDRDTGHHFMRDHFMNTRPKEEWTGKSTERHFVDGRISEIPLESFRMVLYFGIKTEPFRTLAELADRQLEPIPLALLGLDLRRKDIVGFVELQPKDDPRKGSRMPLF